MNQDNALNLKDNIVINSMDDIDPEFSLSLRISEFESDKELRKFIKATELIIRKLPEYRVWTQYIRYTLGYTECEITKEQHDETTVEIHHHPFTLYTLCEGVILDKLDKLENFCTLDIAMEVIKMHFDMKVAFCLLVTSIHEKYHNGYIKIPMEIVKGDYLEFVKTYMHLLPESEQNRITGLLAVNKENCGWKQQDWYTHSNANNKDQ